MIRPLTTEGDIFTRIDPREVSAHRCCITFVGHEDEHRKSILITLEYKALNNAGQFFSVVCHTVNLARSDELAPCLRKGMENVINKSNEVDAEILHAACTRHNSSEMRFDCCNIIPF